MQFYNRLERNKEQELVIRTALYVVFGGRGLAFGVKRAGLCILKQRLDWSSILVGVEKLTSLGFDLVCDIAVALGDVSTFPWASLATAC